MTNRWLKLLSIVLSLVLIFNLLPLQALASNIDETPQLPLSTLPEDGSSGSTTGYQRLDTATVVEEDTSRRGEYYKEFVLNNGLRLAAVYADPVHFEEDGQWKDIDNTLKAVNIKGVSGYTNTAGVWQVYFPQQLTGSNAISVTKDGYTVSFGMAGELTNSGNIAVASIGASSDILATSAVKTTTAQIRAVDLTEQKAAAQYEQTVLEKHHSKLAYSSVYDNTEVVYDLTGNRLKESIVISKYDASLWGYRYNLNTGGLIPVLLEDNTIELRHPETAEVVMTMPAPFMVDANDEYSYDVDVSLVQKNGGYLLSYYVPRAWLASSDRVWPVVLDPVIEPDNSYSNIQDISFTPTVTETYRHSTLKVGYSTSNGIYRTYIRFVALPDLSSADNIAAAYITLRKPSTSSKSVAVEVHKVNQPWTDRTISWGNNDSFNDIVEDSITIQNPANYTWDITNIVRGWYEDTANLLTNNTGMMFKTTSAVENAGESNWHQFCASNYAQYVTGGEGTEPSLAIIINNTNGLEDYWDYTSVSAGRAGTGYIQNYSGNLVWVHNDMGFDGNRMPVSISHIYNPMLSGSNKYGLGYGWQTNYHQTVKQASDNSYVWTDGDGTPHHFYPTDTGVYQDEDNLHLTLSILSNKYILTDQYGNISEFEKIVNGTNQDARLTKQENNQSTKSSVNISYSDQSSKRISQITDGVGRVYAFVYSGDLLDKIEYKPSGDTVRYTVDFNYTTALLTSVKYADSKESFYTYNTKNLLTKVQNIDGYSINFTYGTSGADKLRRVLSVTEKYITETNDTLTGKQTTFTYGLCSTKVTTHEGTDEQYQAYHFDKWGNTVSVYDEDGRAVVSKYKPVLQQGDPAHLVTATSSQQITVNNLLSNTSFEGTAMPWTAVGESASTIVSSRAYLGSNSMHLSTDVSSIQSPEFNAAPGESYTFSAYLQAENAEYARIGFIVNNVSLPTQSGPNTEQWTRVSVTYTNDTSSTTTIRAKIYGSSNYDIYVDCVQLEKGQNASRYNLIENGNFNSLTGWDTSGASGIAYASGVRAPADQQNAGSLKIDGTLGTTQVVSQTVYINKSSQRYVVAGWAKDSGLPTAGSTTRSFAIRATMHLSGDITSTTVLPFTIGNTDQWQYVAAEIGASMDCEKIDIELIYDDNCGTVYFDGIGLYWEKFGDSYSYDSNNNLTTVEDQLMNTTRYMYYDNGVDVKTVNYPTGIRMDYTYDAYHNVKSVGEYGTNDQGQKSITKYDYDVFGNITQVAEILGGKAKVTSAVYTENHNYLDYTEDEARNITVYEYDEETGVLQWVMYPNDTWDTRTQYTYDDMFRLVRVQSGSQYAAYTYTGDQLNGISTESTSYTLNYGDFGQRLNINAGSYTLASYKYTNDTNRHLEKLYYGQRDTNADYVHYTYDEKGRVVAEEHYENGNNIVDSGIYYEYDYKGQMIKARNSETGISRYYKYDELDRVESWYEETNNGTKQYGIRYIYDGYGNVSEIVELANGDLRAYSYSYDSHSRPSTSNATYGAATEYSYDNYGALISQSTTFNDVSIIERNYVHRSLGEKTLEIDGVQGTYEQFSGQVEELHIDTNQYDVNYQYAYDDNGNIQTETKTETYDNINEANTTTYHYDSKNQLIREDNEKIGVTWTHQYDDAGNIVESKMYPYSIGALGTAIHTESYTYGNASWGDLLTAYRVKTNSQDTTYQITYDPIGNPLSDGIRSYQWEKGRQLEKLTMDGTEWTYTYDANGMRTGRSGGGETYQYVYSGSQLRKMTVDGHTLIFDYDATGHPLTVTYDGCVFFYVTNLQGDVIGIVNGDGTQITSYAYDAWGRVFNANDHTAGQIPLNQYNPLCYRGYVYDQETGLYYLQSRYYNPQWGRFINADAYISTGTGLIGYNMFAYCNNNPVNCYDPSGQGAITTLLVTALVCGVLSFGADVAGQMVFEQKTLDNIDWRSATISGISGFCAGLIPGSSFWSLTGQAVVSSLVDNGLRAIWMEKDFQINNVIIDSAILLGTGYVMKGISQLSQKVTSKIFCKAPNYSQYQHYFRSKGHNYSRQEVYTHMRKHMKLQRLADEVVDSFLDFTSSFLLYPV